MDAPKLLLQCADSAAAGLRVRSGTFRHPFLCLAGATSAWSFVAGAALELERLVEVTNRGDEEQTELAIPKSSKVTNAITVLSSKQIQIRCVHTPNYKCYLSHF